MRYLNSVKTLYVYDPLCHSLSLSLSLCSMGHSLEFLEKKRWEERVNQWREERREHAPFRRPFLVKVSRSDVVAFRYKKE